MSCQCQGVRELFNEKYVSKDLENYRKKGPADTTRMLVDAIRKEGVAGLTLLDIGGGVGPIQHELLALGVKHATSVEASPSYHAAAQAEAFRRNVSDRIAFRQGNFSEVADEIPPADIVTLDKVICCYDSIDLVARSVERARKIYGLVYPRDTWGAKLGMGVLNFFYFLEKCPYRAFVHSTKAVDEIIRGSGFTLQSNQHTFTWQVAVYTR
jgi:magnesium-protoporphyrin O-methyltransferase